MANRRRRLLLKLANLPVSKEEREKRKRQRLIAETEQWMTRPVPVYDAREVTFPPITKDDIDNLVAAVAASSTIPVEYFMPAGIIEGLKADQIFIDDPLKKQLEDAPCERRYNEQVQDVEGSTAPPEGRVEDGGCDG